MIKKNSLKLTTILRLKNYSLCNHLNIYREAKFKNKINFQKQRIKTFMEKMKKYFLI